TGWPALFLNVIDPLDLPDQAGEKLRRHRRPDRRDVILDPNRAFRLGRDGTVVRLDFVRGGLAHVRRYGDHGIRTDFARMPGKDDRVLEARSGHASDDWHSSPALLHGDLHHALALVVAQAGKLAGVHRRHDAVDLRLEAEADDVTKSRLVQVSPK